MIKWIEGLTSGRLAIMPHPNGFGGLPADIKTLRSEGVDVLACLLTDEELGRFGLAREQELCEALGIEFLSFPITDHSVPPRDEQTFAFLRSVYERVASGRSVVAHCFAGIGRSSLVAASVMVLQGFRVVDAFDAISAARGFSVPDTIEQLEWVTEFARDLRGQPKDG